MDHQEFQEKKKRSDKRWGVITLAALIGCTPLGVGLIVAKHLDLLPDIGGKLDVREILEKNLPDTWREPENGKRRNTHKGMPKGGGAISAFGILFAIIMGISSVGSAFTLFSEALSFGNFAATALCLSLMAVGVVFGVYGKVRKDKRRRFEAYLKLIGNQTAVSIHAMSDVLGMDYRKVLKDLKEMILRGILSPAWLDMKTYRLMLTEYTGEEPEEKREECLSRSERILRQIRADNDLIDDEEVSRKIDRIEDLTRKIFAIVDAYPEKEKQLYSFLNYYLPTTLKALESYARLEAQGVETAAIRETKQKINVMLDELAEGYEKQLDKLFEDDVVDITADIEVMRRMLHKDGLTENEFTKQ